MHLHIYPGWLDGEEWTADRDILVAEARDGHLQVYLDSHQAALQALFDTPLRLKDGRVLTPWTEEQLRYITVSALLPLGLVAEVQ